ncbi:MAG: hypothetical protein M3Z05_08075 [Gemmatimonadota bacterium]|nr:hypothetical protein [Gemmatimonadota bacterium]
MRDTVLNAVVSLDSTFLGYPEPGNNRDITLITQGDTADVRIGIHYDTLPTRYQILAATSDSLIRKVDSATLIFRIDTLSAKPTTPITIDAFDIDTTATDTTTATILPLFRADRLIGSQTYTATDFSGDTLRMSLSNDAIFAKIRDTLRLRVGLRVRGAGTAKLRMLGTTFPPRIRFRASPDTTVKPDTLFPTSVSPAGDLYGQSVFRLFPVYVKGLQPAPPVGRFIIGGLAGARTFLRFDIPAALIDSVTVIRASLQLTQLPGRDVSATADSVSIYVQPVLASPSITDILTASTFLGPPGLYGIDSVRFGARGTGLRSLELVNLLRFWRAAGLTNTSRSIVLRSPQEGNTPGELDFVSTEGALGSRPTLRITYVPRRGFGIP